MTTKSGKNIVKLSVSKLEADIIFIAKSNDDITTKLQNIRGVIATGFLIPISEVYVENSISTLVQLVYKLDKFEGKDSIPDIFKSVTTLELSNTIPKVRHPQIISELTPILIKSFLERLRYITEDLIDII